jgi:hypothetical protein
MTSRHHASVSLVDLGDAMHQKENVFLNVRGQAYIYFVGRKQCSPYEIGTYSFAATVKRCAIFQDLNKILVEKALHTASLLLQAGARKNSQSSAPTCSVAEDVSDLTLF